MYANVLEVLLIILKEQKQSPCSSTDRQTSKRCSAGAPECYSAIKRNEALTRAPRWMNLENMFSEKSQTQKTMYGRIPFI